MSYHRGIGDTPIIGTFQTSTNPGSVQAVPTPPTSYTKLLVLVALGGVGYLVYRHFHKSSHVTVAHHEAEPT